MASQYRQFLTLCLVLGLLSALLPALANAQESTTILGQVVNGTSEAPLPAGLEVTLHIEKGGEAGEIRTAQVNPNGAFQFQGVSLEEDFRYFVTTDYQGIVYEVELEPDRLSTPIQLTVYEITSSIEGTYVTNALLIVTGANPDTRTLEVLEIIGLENRGDRAFLPDTSQAARMNFLRFPLPPTYANLEVQSNLQGGQVIPVDKGFGLTAPVPPGRNQIIFTYHILYEGSQVEFTRSLPLGANNVRIVIPEELGSIRAPAFQVLAPVTMGGTSYRLLQAQELDRGATLTIEAYDLPQPSWLRRWKDTLTGVWFSRVAIPLAAGVALVGILFHALRSKRAPSQVIRGRTGHGATVEENRRALLETIARLDERFERGQIKEADYHQQRRELKASLLQLTIGGLTEGGSTNPSQGSKGTPR